MQAGSGLRPSDLHVIAVISNPMRYRSRVRLMREFIERMLRTGVSLTIVEATFGERAPDFHPSPEYNYVRVRHDQEIWLKEPMINLGYRSLPEGARYIMWCDADIEFKNPGWVMETLHGLQHFHTLQPFTHVVDMGKHHELLLTHTGFGYQYDKGDTFQTGYGTFWHPGYAWAYRRSAWEALGGMMDGAVCGAADHHMAAALIGKGLWTVHGETTDGYKRMVSEWQTKADALTGRHGCVSGTILHHYHGPKEKRYYVERWDILINHAFDPYTDLFRDANGMPVLTSAKPKLLQDLRRYLAARDEDA